MNTFILKWNPAISSYTLEQFADDFQFGKKKDVLVNESPWRFNWSVWEHEKAHEGDRFFMVRVGDGPGNGVVMSGSFDSEPYEGEDWSGKGRQVHYVDLVFDTVVRLSSNKVLPAATLAEKLPGIEWDKGHSGMLIAPDEARELEKMWYESVKDGFTPLDKARAIAQIAHFGQKDKAGEDYIHHPERVADFLDGTEEIVALLHDVVEDSDYTLDDLAGEGFSKAALAAINAITRREGEDYEAYIRRAGRNKTARAVKMADLIDNMDLTRLPELTDDDWQRVKKYHKAYKYLCGLWAGATPVIPLLYR